MDGDVDGHSIFNTRRLVSVWYNRKAFHSMPILNNALLKENMLNVLNQSDTGSLLTSYSYGISTINHQMNIFYEVSN
jgi:hypothetical protein